VFFWSSSCQSILFFPADAPQMPADGVLDRDARNVRLERAALAEAIRHEFRKKLDSFEIEFAVSKGIEAYVVDSKRKTIENRYGYELTAARNDARKQLRRKNHERPMSEVTVEPDAHDMTEQELDVEDRLQKILALLPNEVWRTAFRLHEEGFDAEEIAERMDRSKDAAYHLVERARKRAGEIYLKLGFPPPAIAAPINLKINQKNLEIKWRISRGIWPYTINTFYQGK